MAGKGSGALVSADRIDGPCHTRTCSESPAAWGCLTIRDYPRRWLAERIGFEHQNQLVAIRIGFELEEQLDAAEAEVRPASAVPRDFSGKMGHSQEKAPVSDLIARGQGPI